MCCYFCQLLGQLSNISNLSMLQLKRLMLCQPPENQQPSHTNEGSFHVEFSAIANIASQANLCFTEEAELPGSKDGCSSLSSSVRFQQAHQVKRQSARPFWQLFMWNKMLKRRQQTQNGESLVLNRRTANQDRTPNLTPVSTPPGMQPLTSPQGITWSAQAR